MNVTRLEKGNRLSSAVIIDKMVYLSGMTGDHALPTVAEQARSMLEKMEKRLALCGSDKEHMVSAVIYLKDIKEFCNFNNVWDDWVSKDNPPVRTCVEAQMASEDILVEITTIAYQK